MALLSILLHPLFQQSGPAATTPYLILGYVVMWIIGAVYVITLIARQRNLRQDIDLLHKLLEEDEQEPRDQG